VQKRLLRAGGQGNVWGKRTMKFCNNTKIFLTSVRSQVGIEQTFPQVRFVALMTFEWAGSLTLMLPLK
jgi:hypothetical protein